MPKLIVADLSQTTGCTTNYAPWGAWPCRWFGAAWGLQTSSFAAAETKHGSAVFVPHLISPVQPMGLSEERCNQCNLEICTRGWKFLRAKCQGTKFVYIYILVVDTRTVTCTTLADGNRLHGLSFRLNRLLDPRVQRYFEAELKKGRQEEEIEALETADAGGSSNFGTVLLILTLVTSKQSFLIWGAALMTLRKPCFWMFLIPPIFWRSSVGFSKSYCRSFWWQRWW